MSHRAASSAAPASSTGTCSGAAGRAGPGTVLRGRSSPRASVSRPKMDDRRPRWADRRAADCEVPSALSGRRVSRGGYDANSDENGVAIIVGEVKIRLQSAAVAV